ncbi:MAG TPA: TonB-dependent receptor [Vicinamibacterales bacterium]
MSSVRRILGAALFAACTPGLLWAGQPPAALTIQVRDATGGALVGATCELSAPDGGILPAAVEADGHCRFGGLEPGTYTLRVTLSGFEPDVRQITVRAGQLQEPSVTLAPAGLSDTVVVSATRVPTPVSALPNTVTIVGRDAIEQRTAASDDLASLLETNVPGFGPSLKKLTGRGETLRGRNPLYTINGVPQHTPLRDGERDGHTIDLDFVERIEVIHGSNAVQGIGATGGVVNLVTKSPRSDGSWTHDVKLSTGNADTFERDGWSSKFSYLLGKRFGKVEWVAGVAAHKRGLFFDADGRAIGLYPTQGDIMDSTSRDFFGKVGVDLTPSRRLEILVNDFTLERDGDFVPVPGDRRTGRLTTSVPGDPRATVGDPARNDTTTVSIDYRDRQLFGGELAIQAYAQDYDALFEGGEFTTFALTVGGPALLDQSIIASDKLGAKATWSVRDAFAGVTPMLGVDVSTDTSAQRLARTNRIWVPEMTLREIAPFIQLQRTLTQKVLLTGGVRIAAAELQVGDFTTLPSSMSTFVRGGSPTFTELLPNVGAVFYPADALSFYASYAEGFTMADVGRVLRGVTTPGLDVDSLVDVKPVVTGNIEVGTDVRLSGARLHAAYYRSNADRGSVLERTADSQIFTVRREKTAIDGIDLTASVPLTPSWTLGGTYSWLRGRFDTNRDGRVDTDLDGLNIAPGRVNLHLDGQPARWMTTRLQVSILRPRTVEGRAPPANGREFGGYTLADLSLGFPTELGTFRVGIENLLDKQYLLYFSQVDTGAGNDTLFAGPGRSIVLGFERRF